MPKFKDEIEKCKHPNSRKTKALSREIKKKLTREKLKLQQNIKQSLLSEKLLWFQNHILRPECCTPEEAENLIKKYLGRFDEELNQIKIKHFVGNRKSRQHASREDIINMTIKRETEEYNTCGLEIPNLFNTEQMKLLKQWNGEARFLPNFKLQRIGKKHIEAKMRDTKQNVNVDDKMDVNQ